MKERGIPFTGESVRATQGNRQSQTRRVIVPQPCENCLVRIYYEDDRLPWPYQRKKARVGFRETPMVCPYGQVGDLLWVKETWAHLAEEGMDYEAIYYKADGRGLDGLKWRSPRFMPKQYARIWLEITGLRAERLWEITNEDARCEGFLDSRQAFVYEDDEIVVPVSAKEKFANYWESLNAKQGYPWESNPWVWVISFKGIELTLGHHL